MSTIYKIKHIPKVVAEYFAKRFPHYEGYTYSFYWYKGMEGKTYGCEVYKDGEYWHNATQATLEGFIKLMPMT